MNHTNLAFFTDWFNSYVLSFHTGDINIDVNYILKEEHTQRVRINSANIANSISLCENDLLLAQAISLFHDIGRFRQYYDYNSSNDLRTGSHATMGVRVLEESNVLACLVEEEQSIILEAIEYHNMISIPTEVTGRTLLHSQLIRDADKLDGFYVITNEDELRKYSLEPLAEDDSFSQNVLNCLMECKSIDYKEIRTLCDRKMLELALVYDLNFQYSRELVIKKGYIEKLINYLPESKEKSQIKSHFELFLNRKELTNSG